MAKWNSESWSEVSPYLDQALELAGDERRVWLDDLAATRLDIAVKVRGLLGRHEGNTIARFLEQSPLAAVAAHEPGVGDQVGAYTLVNLLGRGGMGTVWLARRSDGRFEGTVAIKILSRCGFGPEAPAQLRREASSLARLSHPNVARLLDAGICADGRPFLILEYVEGKRIDQFCECTPLSLTERLRLFLAVIDAVAHAHTQGIVHRDLKPSNILVTSERVPKLLDFGVAVLQPEKLVDKRGAPEGEPAGMTPGYAAPEQIRGEPATPASDVYALGILLYLLITDRHPHGNDNATPTQLIEATLVSDCKRASDSLESTGLRRWVRGDLDSIIAKATDREAVARYADASQLAEAVRRFLDARTSRRQRTRSAVLLPGVLLFFAIGGTLWGTWWNRDVQATRWAGAQAINQDSIAVLPFNDLSEGQDQQYFSDGLSEELIDRLAQVTNLRVIARTSSFQFKGKQEDVRSIARTLTVGYLLQGSVRKSGSRLRIGVQLIRATDGSQMWSQTYEHSLDDIFKVQTDIADRVARVLNVTLRNVVAGSALAAPNAAAYNLVLQGNFFKARATRMDVDKAVSLYKEAIGLDPKYALPWALLGEAYYMETESEWIDRAGGLAQARAALERSLQIDPDLVWAHCTLANIYTSNDLNWTAAYDEIKRARQLEPRESAPLLLASADIESIFGRLEPAIDLYRAALRSDPLNTVALAGLAYTLSAAGRFDEAAATIRRLLELAPDSIGARVQLGIYLLYSGKPAAALAAVQEERDESARMFALPIIYWASGQRHESDAALRELQEKRSASEAYGIACVHAYRGEIDLAMRWLDRAYQQRDMSLSLVKIDPLLHNLQGDRRYQALLRRLKLTSEAG